MTCTAPLEAPTASNCRSGISPCSESVRLAPILSGVRDPTQSRKSAPIARLEPSYGRGSALRHPLAVGCTRGPALIYPALPDGDAVPEWGQRSGSGRLLPALGSLAALWRTIDDEPVAVDRVWTSRSFTPVSPDEYAFRIVPLRRCPSGHAGSPAREAGQCCSPSANLQEPPMERFALALGAASRGFRQLKRRQSGFYCITPRRGLKNRQSQADET
jgi:hypothetical protein